MDPVTVVEVRDPDGIVVQRTLVKEREFTVGRAPDNQVVLDDEFVDARHLSVSVAEGEGARLTVRDLGTLNGTRVGSSEINDHALVVDPSEPVHVGDSVLTFRPADEEVAAAKPMAARKRWRFLPYDRLPAWTLAALTVVLGAVYVAAISYDETEPAFVVGVVLFIVVLMLLWVGAWAVGSKIFTGKARFREHLAFASLVVLVGVPVGNLLGWLDFMANSDVAEVVIGWGLNGWALWAVSLFGHLDIASSKSPRALAVWAGSISGGLMGLAMLVMSTVDAPATVIARSLKAIRPIPTALTRSTTPEVFLEGLPEMEAALVDAAEEALEERPYPE